MAFADKNFPDGVRFNVKEDTVVKYCCEEAPEEEPHATHEDPFPKECTGANVTDSNGSKFLYILVESCGCCKEIVVPCPEDGTTTTTTK